jgi:hypothetical protein
MPLRTRASTDEYATAEHRRVLSSRTINQARFGYVRTDEKADNTGKLQPHELRQPGGPGLRRRRRGVGVLSPTVGRIRTVAGDARSMQFAVKCVF